MVRAVAVRQKLNSVLQATAGVAILLLTMGYIAVASLSMDTTRQANLWIDPGAMVTPLYSDQNSETPIGYSVQLRDRTTVCTMAPDDTLYTCVDTHLRR